MMLSSISGKDGNKVILYGGVPACLVAPAPSNVNINTVPTDSRKLEVTWVWDSSVLESMKSEAASAQPGELPLPLQSEMMEASSRKQMWAKELRIELLARDEASEWNPSWGPRTDVVVSVIHNDGVDPFASSIQIQLPTNADLSAAATDGHKVKLKNGKVHVKVRITSINKSGLLGTAETSNGIDIPIELSAEAAKDTGIRTHYVHQNRSLSIFATIRICTFVLTRMQTCA